MSISKLQKGSLIIFKHRPGLVLSIAKKVEIETEEGQTLNVRPKDVILLHPGPITSLRELQPMIGELEVAWELLAGQTTTLETIAELAFGEFTPSTSWAIWELVEEDLYFNGMPDGIYVRTPSEVAAVQTARAVKSAEQDARQALMARLLEGNFLPEDKIHVLEIAEFALGKRERCQLLSDLGQVETPENAHAFLLKLGFWGTDINPYPSRAGLSTSQPEAVVINFPDEPRRDLTHLIALAIDDQGSKDPDDALSIEGSRLWVHVADVAAIVPPNSPADIEARSREANLYLPEGTISMLPPGTTKMLGLGLVELSPALSFGIDLGQDGEIEALEIIPSWIQVNRLSYEEAEARLDESPLKELFQIARQNEARRMENGAIHIDLPEVKVRMIDNLVEITPLLKLRSRDLVREAMLLAGEAVGRYALQNNIPVPYTYQEPPAGDLQPATTPSQMIARRRMMRSSAQSGKPARHAGLGLEIYVQATSPLRRYLDLVVHQQLRAHLNREKPLDEQAVMQRVGAADAIAGNVRWAERRSIEHWTLVFLLQNPRWCGEGIIIERHGRRNVIMIPELGLESELYMRQELPLDSLITIEVRDVNLPTLVTHFRPSTS